ncbi:MFS transporter [Streptomyces showdoensis]|uniref:MFS transporter n=1 Tax=Streptomyces showdoensis TaxID=68268 RepID=A0A2P2GF78_STREW|nr:MFS transporter [Streptomyces showdoensis]KKZ70168.1 MFS transporter [Streptomyces showdoensis]
MTGERTRRGLFGTGVLVGLMAEQVVMFSVPLLIFQQTRQVSSLGVAYAVEWLPCLLAYPFAGLVADRDGGPRLFSRANTARAAVLACAVLLVALRPEWTVPVLMTTGALLSTLVAPIRMSIEKVVPQLAQGSDLARTQSLVQNMELLAMALGPGLAMVAVLFLGKVWLLALAGALFAAAASCWLVLPRTAAAAPAEARGAGAIVTELALGWRLLVGNRPVMLLAGLNFAINLVFSTVLAANAAVVTGVLKAPESQYAMLNMFVGIVGLLNLLLTPLLLRKFDVNFLGSLGYTVLTGCLLLLGTASSFWLYAAAFVVAMSGVAYFNIFNRTQRVKAIPREHLGKVMGPFFLVGLLSYPMGGLLISTFGASVGPQRLVAALAVLLGVYGAVFMPLTIRSFRAKEVSRVGAGTEPALSGGQ